MLSYGPLPFRKKWNQIRVKFLKSTKDIWTKAERQKISHNVTRNEDPEVLLQCEANEGRSPN
jgi:hypothetical protein